MSNCPKCDKKLKPFYFKQNCPYCGANLMYYDFENRLADDAACADKEWGEVFDFLDGIKKSSVGSAAAIIRLVSFFLPVAALLLPVFKVGGDGLSLISAIKMIINAAKTDIGALLGDKTLICCLAAFAAVILFSLVSLIFSLLSYTKNGLKRNSILSGAELALFVALSLIAAHSGCGITYGFFIVLALIALTIGLHYTVDNKIRVQ